jgi:tetratricopeptide (TPR) repeat protein
MPREAPVEITPRAPNIILCRTASSREMVDLDEAIRMREGGNPVEAVRMLRQLVREGDTARTWYELGRAFREMHLEAAAEACFARALGDAPEAWDVEGSYDPSESVELGIDDAEAWCAMSRVLLSRGEPEAALAAAERALFSGYSEAWVPKVLALGSLGKARAAAAAIEDARRKGVERGTLLTLEALLYSSLRDRERSRAAARKALKWDPGRIPPKRAAW